MIELKVHYGDQVRRIETEPGRSLLEVLNENNLDIHATCGGKGTCGKCSVEVEKEGLVMACQYHILSPISIRIPKTRDMQILSGLNPLARAIKPNSGIEIIPSEDHLTILYMGEKLREIKKN
jgi:uncharacterized 2Fe-2S/4Fe-4S cluster protein (DUF4445 family)